MEDGGLLVHLVTALGAALVGAAVALRLGQPLFVGYILAGVAIGPFTPGIMGKTEAIAELAEIGIIFLMFVIGVQLSLREFLRASRLAILGGLLQVGDTLPLRDVFSGIFFVSIGMLLDPAFLLHSWALVLLTVGLIILVKGAVTSLIAQWLGCSARLAVLLGAALAQSAEFSFLLARIGLEERALTRPIFNLLLSATVVTILLSPPRQQSGARAAAPGAGAAPRHGAGQRHARASGSSSPPPRSGGRVVGFGQAPGGERPTSRTSRPQVVSY